MPASPSAHIGANVRAEMARRNVSQTTLAAALGITQAGISKRIRGQVPFTIDQLVKIAAALDVPLATLTEGVDLKASA